MVFAGLVAATYVDLRLLQLHAMVAILQLIHVKTPDSLVSRDRVQLIRLIREVGKGSINRQRLRFYLIVVHNSGLD